jgi:hypothetical protein
MHVLQPCDLASRVHFCSLFLQSQLTFFSDDVQFHLQGYKNTQNNHYWSTQTPHLTHEILLHPMKVCV